MISRYRILSSTHASSKRSIRKSGGLADIAEADGIQDYWDTLKFKDLEPRNGIPTAIGARASQLGAGRTTPSTSAEGHRSAKSAAACCSFVESSLKRGRFRAVVR